MKKNILSKGEVIQLMKLMNGFCQKKRKLLRNKKNALRKQREKENSIIF
jgi:hypothetical protein